MPGLVRKVETSRLFERLYVEDGYEFMNLGELHGWRAVPGWGVDGWDLGDWPYVVVLFRDRIVKPSTLDNDPAVKEYERAIYVEGDITIETYASAGDREAATDETALFYWRANNEPWLALPEADLRGPYRRRAS